MEITLRGGETILSEFYVEAPIYKRSPWLSKLPPLTPPDPLPDIPRTPPKRDPSSFALRKEHRALLVHEPDLRQGEHDPGITGVEEQA